MLLTIMRLLRVWNIISCIFDYSTYAVVLPDGQHQNVYIYIYIYIYISCFDKPFIQTTLSPICLTIDSDYKSRYQIRETSHGKRHHGVWNQIHTLFTSLWKSPTNKTYWYLGTFFNLNLIIITLSVFDTCFVDRPHTSRVVAYFKMYMFKWQSLSLA